MICIIASAFETAKINIAIFLSEPSKSRANVVKGVFIRVTTLEGLNGHVWRLSTVPDRREDKELIDSLHQDPLGVSKVHLLTCLPAEGAPQGLRGWGVRIGGLGKSSPAGLDSVQGLVFLPC
jgi:hypothetical protein